ncbi:MAG TPA: ABC transporter permease [Candidatus Acidoferrum sp.]|nr:ABC transporter permease [Candidatus Acidoferrum sp.]
MKFLAEFRESVGISWDAVRANKMRSALATIGIVIGIVTVTLMGAAINGLDQAFRKSLSAMGGDTFFISRSSWLNRSYDEWFKMQKRRPVRPEDAEALRQQLTLVSAIDPAAYDNETVKYKDRSADGVTIMGTTPDNLITTGASMAQGRFLTAADAEGGQPVCVLGSELATNLFRDESPLGKRIKIQDQSFLVVGVLQSRGNLFGDLNLDLRVAIPLREFLAEIWNRPDITIEVKANGLAQLDETREELRQAMRHIRHLRPDEPDDFAINQQDQFVDLFHKETSTIAIIGLFVTSLSLFVGGIGIMNIMFVSVVERTREIGVRKAIGARRVNILMQFLLEAVTLAGIGGVIGVLVGSALGLSVRLVFSGLPTSISLFWVAAGLTIAAMIGIFFGVYPAWKASKLSPVDALRYE